MGAQGLALSVERVLGGHHFHLASAEPQPRSVSDLDGHRYLPEIFDPTSDPVLNHLDPQEHEHEFGQPGVIHVADSGSVSSSHPHATLIRSAHDLGWPMVAFEIQAIEPWSQDWADARASPFNSHITPPLERPPQA